MSAPKQEKKRKQFEIDSSLCRGVELLSKHWGISEREIIERGIRAYFREALRRIKPSTKWGEDFLNLAGKGSANEGN
jgi:hypothetical protein